MFMGVSPEESKWCGGNAAERACGQPACFTILHRTVLRRRILCPRILWRGFLIALLAGVVCWTGFAMAQEERPEITPGERKAPRKKDAGPRAIALLQMGANGKVSLVPIAILIGGKFWDASAYKADPVPMALDPGTVYEGERAGSSLGLFTVNSALHSRTVNSQIPWIATGKWVPGGSEPAKTAVKAETAPVGIDKSDGPPRLTRDPAKVAAPASGAPGSTTAPASGAPASSSAPSSSTQSGGQSGSGDEPPRLTKGASTAPSTPSATPPTGSSGPATTGESKPDSKTGDTKPSDSKPGDAKPADAKADDHVNVPTSDSGASEANRPRLRRGKPVEPLPEDDVPGYSRPGATTATTSPGTQTTNAAKAAQAIADTAPVDLVPAISDATGPQPRSYAYEWLKDEEGERREQMVALAKQKVRAYVEALAKSTLTPTAQAARHGASTKAAVKMKDPILDNVKMTSFDVWTTNQPVMVFSAQAHMPPAAGTAQADSDSAPQYSVLMVAYPDTYNNLHPIYVGVTDKYHLDLTPRLELVDVVDADGDGRGELLFREITDGGNGWVIYRATADKLWKMFDSLHPE
jgi:hypothetical protein